MSDGVREWRFYVDDMIAFAEKVLAYTAGLDQPAFVANTLVYARPCATSNSSARLRPAYPHDVRHAHPQVPWRMIVATRNRLIHAYLGIDNDTRWSIVSTDVPALLPALRAVRLHTRG